MNRPVDVLTADKPAEDNEHYFGNTAELVSKTWSKGQWTQGDLLGENGSDPATKAQSPSYAPRDQWDQLTEDRSATSTGHIRQYPRPPNVSLGWGGYDKCGPWQSYGRQVTKDMVENEDWSTDMMKPMKWLDEEGKVVSIMEPTIKPEDLPKRKPPLTLWQVLDKEERERNDKEHDAGEDKK